MTGIDEQLTKYLTDAHAIEEQALAQLRAAPDLAGDPGLAQAYRDHLAETEGHEERVRGLLEGRDAKPSWFKDLVLAAGGKGFVLFARVQPDTPGKLHAHAVAYEALELASYELLARVADRAGEDAVAEAARSIAGEERRMLERLEGGYDAAVDASLRELAPDDLAAQLRTYLADAHALEEQGIELLERASEPEAGGPLAGVFAEHLDESRDHAELVQQRLTALGGDSSTPKDTALRVGALNWSAFFGAHPDTPGKLAAFAFAFEHLELAGHEQLRRVAERAGDAETARLAERIAGQEREAATRIAGLFDAAARAALESAGVR